MGKHVEVDSEKLIASVKRYEHIWNKDLMEYHRKNMKEAAWHSVGREFYDDWDSLDEEDRSGKLFMLKKRWNNIRDYYKKDLALQLNGSIGQPAMKRKKYMFSNMLDFLRPNFKKILTGDKQSDNEQDDEYLYVDYSSDTEDSLPLKRKLKEETMDRETHPESIATNTEAQADSTDDESDLLFLKSLAPDMKALSRRQKIDFKLGILQLYKNIITQPQAQHRDPLQDDDSDEKISI